MQIDLRYNEEGKVDKITLEEAEIPTKPISLSEVERVVGALKTLNEVINLSKAKFPKKYIEKEEIIPEWTPRDFKRFIRKCTKWQKIYLKTIFRKKTAYTEDLVDALRDAGKKNAVSQSISGIRSGLTKLFNSKGKEDFVEIIYDENKSQNLYKVKPQYLEFEAYIKQKS